MIIESLSHPETDLLDALVDPEVLGVLVLHVEFLDAGFEGLEDAGHICDRLFSLLVVVEQGFKGLLQSLVMRVDVQGQQGSIGHVLVNWRQGLEGLEAQTALRQTQLVEQLWFLDVVVLLEITRRAINEPSEHSHNFGSPQSLVSNQNVTQKLDQHVLVPVKQFCIAALGAGHQPPLRFQVRDSQMRVHLLNDDSQSPEVTELASDDEPAGVEFDVVKGVVALEEIPGLLLGFDDSDVVNFGQRGHLFGF